MSSSLFARIIGCAANVLHTSETVQKTFESKNQSEKSQAVSVASNGANLLKPLIVWCVLSKLFHFWFIRLRRVCWTNTRKMFIFFSISRSRQLSSPCGKCLRLSVIFLFSSSRFWQTKREFARHLNWNLQKCVR